MDLTRISHQQRIYLSFLPHVRQQFGSIPGVRIIGLGAKERKNQILDEWAFRFYVDKKKPLNSIPAHEIIPNKIFNIQTDVISFFDKEDLICEECEPSKLTVNDNEYRDDGIRGGISIRNEYFDNDHPTGYGTLGILARRKSDNALVGLTCSHVVNAGSESNTKTDVKIGQPKYWISCCCCPRGYIGDVKKATFTDDLDCALIEIHEDIRDNVTSKNTENKVEDFAADISGAAAIVCFDTLKKYGRATGLTEGKVSEIAFGTNHMLIERTGGDPDDPFACHGDSGAVIINSSNQVVGLLVAAQKDNMLRTIATHIKPVMADLGITIAGTDVADIGEPVGGGDMGCELNYWPGGHNDPDLNPLETFTSEDFNFTGPIDWDVSKGAPGALILESNGQTGSNLSRITVRYGTVSASKNPTDAVWIEASKTGEQPVTKFRTIFKVTPNSVNTGSALDGDNLKRFATTGGTNTQAGVALPGTDGATWFLAKAEIVFDILPTDLSWFAKGLKFETGEPGEILGNVVARRQTKFTKGEQSNGAAHRTHTDQVDYASAGGSTLDDFQEPFVDSPNKIFRLANEGFDPSNLLQGYWRADFRDYLEFHDGTAWIRITPYAEWFANLTADLSGTGTPPPSVGAVNAMGEGANSEKIPNQPPTLTVTDFQEVKPGELVTMSATPVDPDNDDATVNWAQTDGPNVALSSPTGNTVTFNAPANDPQLKFTATADDKTGTLSKTAGNNLSAPTTVTINVIEWLDRLGGNPGLCVNNEEVFNAVDFGIGAGVLNWDVTTGSTSAVIVEADGASIAPSGTVNGANSIKVNYNNVSADTTRQNSVKIQATNPANGKIWYKRRTVNLIPFAIATTITPGAPPSHALAANEWGWTQEESINVTICAYRNGADWQAFLLTMNGNYSVQARLLAGVTEVTGHGGAAPGTTVQANYCNQINDLNALSVNWGSWFMVSAIQAHENVHVTRLLPALSHPTVQGALATAINALKTPHVPGMNQAGAIAAIIASPGFAAAIAASMLNWTTRFSILIANDHGPGGVFSRAAPTYAAEIAVVNPMITAICSGRPAGWPACPPLCP